MDHYLRDDGSPRGFPIPAPTRIGPFEVVSELARGGMSLIYRCRQENPPREVAAKVIQPGRVSCDSLRRFRRESRVLGMLQHPGIAQVFEAGVADFSNGPQPYIGQ